MLPIGSDILISLNGLYDRYTDTVVNDATVTGRVLNPNSTVFTTFTLASTGVSGNYRGTITAAVSANLVAGSTYVVEVTANAAGILVIDRDSHVANYL